MRYLYLIALLVTCLDSGAQVKISRLLGSYADHFGNNIKIRSDSTFRFEHHFDMQSYWSIGTWRLQNDTIFFATNLIYDTVKTQAQDLRHVDSLILSFDENAEVILASDTAKLSWWSGQNRYPIPNKFFFRKDKLFNIDEKGRLIKKRRRGFWTPQKWIPWYFKLKEK